MEVVRRLTDGKGVDVVLNCLAGNLLHARWSCIARFGRFIEIGKRDTYENAKLDTEHFRRNVSFHSLDLVTLFQHNKPLGARLLKQSMMLVEERKIRAPEPIQELSYAEAEKGIKLVQAGKHEGKVVHVPHEDEIVPVSLPKFNNFKLRDCEKTSFIVGRLGGLGSTLAEWMIRKGAHSLALKSRSGTSSAQASNTKAWLEVRDIKVRVFTADATNYTAVKNCIDSLGPQLAGLSTLQ